MPRVSKKEGKPFYITTTLPYVNADPHIGFAMEIIRADVVARYRKLVGDEIFFNTGTDEHGLKIYQKAFDLGEDPQRYVDRYVLKFKDLKKVLGLSQDLNFIRTTDPHHIKSAQKFWILCDKNGYIYKKKYKTKYCVGCELERTDSEILNGRCFIHQNLDLEIIEEENYFFKFSQFQKKLLDLYKSNPSFVIPDYRFNEIKSFVKNGLEDFSISRIKEKMSWGIKVPGDPNHVMYVWFDALVNYVSAIGWPDDMEKFNKWWIESGGVVQYCGKDNLRQQSAMWQAMLMSVGLPPSKNIVIDGFVTGQGGVKMSKSLGNTVSPADLVKEYGTDALRYFLIRELHPFEDSPFTIERFKDAYNANLANGLGNLASRIMKMASTNLSEPPKLPEKSFSKDFIAACDSFDLQKATNIIWENIGDLDKKIQETEPFKLIKTDKKKATKIIEGLVVGLYTIGRMLNPILPETSLAIKTAVKENKMFTKPLFPRKD